MALTSAQKTTLKADIAANTNQILWQGQLTAINAMPNNGDANFEIAKWYSSNATPDYYCLRTNVAVGEIYDAITWANFTPADAPDNTVTYQNRAILCQTKQMNLQLMLQGRDTFDASKPSLRGGLNDATTNLPSGASGASRSGGWATILPVLRRLANRIEKLFATQGSGVGITPGDALGATTNPALLTYQGTVSYQDIEEARAS